MGSFLMVDDLPPIPEGYSLQEQSSQNLPPIPEGYRVQEPQQESSLSPYKKARLALRQALVAVLLLVKIFRPLLQPGFLTLRFILNTFQLREVR